MSGSGAALEPLVRRLRAAGCVFAEEEAALVLAQAGDDDAEVDRLVTAREQGLPLEQVLGWAELGGVRVGLEPGVFVPRRRTELMVAAAVSLGLARWSESGRSGADERRVAGPERPLSGRGEGVGAGGGERGGVVLLDLCCGSGAVAAAVGRGLRQAGVAVQVTAADVDPAAVRCAARNLPGARVLESDLFAALPDDLRGRVDVLTANVPYVPTDALALMPREAREHEPTVALDGGDDGLAVLRRVAAQAPTWLAPGATVLFETSERQAPDAVAALADAGLDGDVRTDDDLGAVVVLGSRPGSRQRSGTGPRR